MNPALYHITDNRTMEDVARWREDEVEALRREVARLRREEAMRITLADLEAVR